MSDEIETLRNRIAALERQRDDEARRVDRILDQQLDAEGELRERLTEAWSKSRNLSDLVFRLARILSAVAIATDYQPVDPAAPDTDAYEWSGLPAHVERMNAVVEAARTFVGARDRWAENRAKTPLGAEVTDIRDYDDALVELVDAVRALDRDDEEAADG